MYVPCTDVYIHVCTYLWCLTRGVMVKTCMYIAYTCTYGVLHVHTLYIVPHIVCTYHYSICHCALACTVFDIGMFYAIVQESTIVYIQGHTSYKLPKNGLARWSAFGRQRVVGRMLGPMADADLVCLNLNRHGTRQQPVSAYRPAGRANKKAAAKRIYQCTYSVQQCLYMS